jgi:hypothetical protein
MDLVPFHRTTTVYMYHGDYDERSSKIKNYFAWSIALGVAAAVITLLTDFASGAGLFKS